jgi:hypothetical protein
VSDLAARVAAQRWYHVLELPGGVVTPGEWDLRAASARLPWPDLDGARCLDAGSRDGFYAFEMEGRGAAEVVSLDIDDPDLLDFPGPRPPRELVQAELDAGNRAFELAWEALRSDVQRRHQSLYELREDEVGRFDLAVIGTLLLHLRDPVAALRAVRGVADRLLLNEAIAPGLSALRRRPVAELSPADGPFWWLANPAGLRRMAEAAGWEVERMGRPYVLPWGPGRRPQLRDVVRNGPLRGLPRRALAGRGMLHVSLLAR